MPIFEFRCSDCEKTVELLLRNSDQKPGACPSCGREHLTRVFSAFAVGKNLPEVGRCGNPIPSGGCGRCVT